MHAEPSLKLDIHHTQQMHAKCHCDTRHTPCSGTATICMQSLKPDIHHTRLQQDAFDALSQTYTTLDKCIQCATATPDTCQALEPHEYACKALSQTCTTHDRCMQSATVTPDTRPRTTTRCMQALGKTYTTKNIHENCAHIVRVGLHTWCE